MTNHQPLPPAGLMRRLGALFYDSLIIIAIEMMAAGVIVAAIQALMALNLISIAPYADIGDFLTNNSLVSPIFTFYLAAVWVYFFVYFWTRAGQTLGMRAWKIQLRNLEGGRVTITQALIRLATSGFGLANLAVPLDPQKRGFHDIWAKTQVVVLPKAQ